MASGMDLSMKELRPAKKTVGSAADVLRNIQQGNEFLRENHVLVGIPEEKSSRKGEGPTNAELLFIHSNGSPARGIPARPVIEPAIEQAEAREEIAGYLKEAATNALDGNLQAAETSLQKAGMAGQNAARNYFYVAPWPPNAPETLRRKKSDRPLIDTGAMQKAIIYVIRKKGE